jgi:hypothetical protein
MAIDKTRDRLTTVLDPLRPAVVVRRRVYEVATVESTVPRGFSTTTTPADDEDDTDNGPPSSINVARALASLRADELQRVEDLMLADDADEEARASEKAAPPPAPPPPTLLIGEKTSLTELARQMGKPAKELAATLVSRGFYSMTAKTMLNRETAQAVGEMFGWHVDAAPESDPPEASTKRVARSKRAAARKR